MNNSYFKVAPRDLFNEANFLKCFARLSMLAIDGLFHGLSFDEIGFHSEPLELVQDQCGDLTTERAWFYFNDKPLLISRPLNSREAWPIYTIDNNGEFIEIFDNNGEISNDFLLFLLEL